MKDKETLDELANKFAQMVGKADSFDILVMAFKYGAECQGKKMYSIMEEYADYCLMCSAEKTLKIPLQPKEWFEQFKK